MCIYIYIYIMIININNINNNNNTYGLDLLNVTTYEIHTAELIH